MILTVKSKREIGNIGEDIATNFLTDKGYDIIKRNYYSAYGEIDIIAVFEEYIVFVEVRTKLKKFVERPIESINNAKQKRIIKTAMIFLSENSFDLQPRFDVIEIFKNEGSFKLCHTKSAFILEDGYEIF